MTPEKKIREIARIHFVGEGSEGKFHATDCVCVEKAVKEALDARTDQCAKAVCEGCEAGKKTEDVDGCWMHPEDDGQHLFPCEAQEILQLKDSCGHEWKNVIDPDNEAVTLGQTCFKCGALKAKNEPQKEKTS